MIRVDRVPKPDGFVEAVEKRGSRWLAEHPNAPRPMDLWTSFKRHLADGFRDLCGYSSMYEPVGTVDHFVSWDEDRARAYDWSNYRYAAAWINSSKRNVASGNLLDPYEIQNGWFEILLPSLQLVVAEGIPADYRVRAEFVLERLHLRDDERVLRQRREWYRMYQDGELSLDGLRRKAPLIAEAVARTTTDPNVQP